MLRLVLMTKATSLTGASGHGMRRSGDVYTGNNSGTTRASKVHTARNIFGRPAVGRAASTASPFIVQLRRSSHYIPPTQYDHPSFRESFGKLHPAVIIRDNYEIWPLFAVTAFKFVISFTAMLWALGNKVDTVFGPHRRDNISRTMNLRKPTVHKMVIINQRYPPWPEMQDVLDKMLVAEKKLLVCPQKN